MGVRALRRRGAAAPPAGLARAAGTDDLRDAWYADTVDYIYTWKMPPQWPLEGRILQHYKLVASDDQRGCIG